jgi:hypothetical protein
MKKILLIIYICFTVSRLSAQTVSDGVMMPKGDLCTGFMYGYDSWKKYWEGTLLRDNGNIGTLTTQSFLWAAAYGVNDKINLIAMVPYVSTKASQGTLHGLKGFQDVMIAGKYRMADIGLGDNVFRAHGVLAFSTPMTSYTPDFLPMSIGLASTNLSWRLNAMFRTGAGLYASATGGYTWRSNVRIDRETYYTGTGLYMTKEVRMPDVLDYVLSAGYGKSGFTGELYYMVQNTLGGGDIRRQDMPFVSNKMNFTKVGALIVWNVAGLKNLILRVSPGYTISGRNVGKSLTLTGGLLYTFHFSKSENQ